MSDLKVRLAGVEFKNPIIAASGTFGFGREYNEFYDIGILGGISSKGLTLKKREGNDSPRVAESAFGMLNAVGLQNPGVEHFIEKDLPFMKQKGVVAIANAAGNTIEEYAKMCARLSETSVDMIELNISCPNVKEGGIAFGVKPESVLAVTKAAKSRCSKPLIVKLSPNVADIAVNARAAEDGGADAVSLINTLGGMAIDWKTRTPVIKNVFGGLSGPAVKPVALKMVWQVYNAVKIPVIGMGGIMTAEDVLEFMVCGASAVMVGTANISDPLACKTIIGDLTKLCKKHTIDKICTVTGTLRV